MERKLENLLHYINTEDYIPAKVLSEKMFVSEKTIRQYIKDFNVFLTPNGARIESKHGYGYRLIINSEKDFNKIYHDGNFVDNDSIPVNLEDRIDFLLVYLLCHKEYIKTEELCDILFVSDSTLALDLKQVRIRLAEYDVKIVTKNKLGIKVEGSEFNLRLCFSNYVVKRGAMAKNDLVIVEEEKYIISEIIMETFAAMDISMPELSVQNLINNLYIAVKRIKNGYSVTFTDDIHNNIHESNSVGLEAAKKISEKIGKIFHIEFSDYEIDFITIHLFGNRINEIYEDGIPNIVISSEIYELVGEMLQFVNTTLKLDLRDDFAIKMSLAKHLVSLDIRLRYNMKLKNPILKDIKKKYSLGYTAAIQAIIPIEKKYNKRMNEDEIGYIALIFELSMKESNELEEGQGKRKNILIVCATGKTSAELLAYQYRKVFGKFLNKITVCNISNLNNEKLDDIDYILTTTPIRISVPVPILEIKMFLDNSEIDYLKKTFQTEKKEVLLKYFDRRLFFTGMEFSDKEEVIRYLCKRTEELIELPDGFLQSVLEREEYGPTDFGDLVALPHPYGRVTTETFASICILDKPVLWSSRLVHLVIMISIADKEDNDLEQFYRQTSEFILDLQKVKKLMKEKSFDSFISLMTDEY